MLITQCKAPTPPATEVKLQSPQGKTQCGTYGHPICSGPGGKHQIHLQQVWNTDLLQRKQHLQTASSKDQDPEENKVVLYIVTNVEPLTVEKNTLERLQGPWREWYKEHLREPSPIQEHSQLTGHQPSPDNFNILGMEGQDMTCLIKEYLYQGE